MTRLLAIVASVVLLLSSTNAMAQDLLTQQRRGYIKGIGAIAVMVDQYKGEDEQATQLKTEVELRLRQAGIQVGPGSAYLMLGRSHPHGLGLCHIQAEIQEFSKFERRHGLSSELPVTTWESSLDGTTQDIAVDDWEAARKVLMAAVDEFLNDYLAANQRGAK
ncbi:hypothetical protein LCGC14_2581700 [marine sediment metagenome]|uniref:Uncharacterized protein n=1 Tax=marine sediment metagenome TaxID=412755 RepID=A0A0F9CQC9_9ZZZZ